MLNEKTISKYLNLSYILPQTHLPEKQVISTKFSKKDITANSFMPSPCLPFALSHSFICRRIIYVNKSSTKFKYTIGDLVGNISL